MPPRMTTRSDRASSASAAGLRQRCADDVEELGGFGGHDWLRQVFLEVPREDFVPDGAWWPEADPAGCYPLVDRALEPGRWAEAVYKGKVR